jgi:hypothetical protein
LKITVIYKPGIRIIFGWSDNTRQTGHWKYQKRKRDAKHYADEDPEDFIAWTGNVTGFSKHTGTNR